MADQLFKNQGIDSAYEREKINYRPKLEYTKDFIPPNVEDLYRESEAIHLEKQMLMVDIVESSEATAERVSRLQNLIEERMKNDVITLDADDAAQLGQPQITFSNYKSAVDSIRKDPTLQQAQLLINIYEEYHASNIEGAIDVEVYRDLTNLSDDISLFTSFFKDCANELKGEFEDFASYESDLLNSWEDMDRRRVSLDRSIRQELGLSPNDPINYDDLFNRYGLSDPGKWLKVDEQVSEYMQLQDKIKSYENNPLRKIKDFGKRKLDSWHEHINSTESVLLKTVSDFLEGGIRCMIMKSIRASELEYNIDQKNLDEVRRVLNNTYNVLAAVEGLLKVSMFELNVSLKGIMLQVLGLLKNPVQSLLKTITQEVIKLRVKLTEPVLEWLSDMGKYENLRCWSFDLLANLVLDGAEALDKRFSDNMLELYKMVVVSTEVNKQKVQGLGAKQTLRSTYKVVKITERIIKQLLGVLDSIESNDIRSLIESAIEEQGWDETYDPTTGKVIKNQREKLIDFAGGI